MGLGAGELIIILIICMGPVLLGAGLAVLLLVRSRKGRSSAEHGADRDR